MQCPHCGNLLAEGSRFCPYCGSTIGAPEVRPAPVPATDGGYAPTGGDLSDPRQSDCGREPVYDRQTYPARPADPDPLNDPRGMKWFKFIIYFQLFANAAVNAYSALTALIGTQYQGKADFVYKSFPGLRAVDLAYGLVLLALAAFAVFTRMRLARFRRNAPLLYYILSIANTLDAVLYVLLVSLVSGVPVGDFDNLNLTVAVAVNLVMLIINLIYFGHRKDLFVN